MDLEDYDYKIDGVQSKIKNVIVGLNSLCVLLNGLVWISKQKELNTLRREEKDLVEEREKVKVKSINEQSNLNTYQGPVEYN